ncbi:MAG: thioredoxin domain-containing protein, partial [Syntrophomonadaceae bacterium]|nr:thioredoxin domain-containing protein [Syntrophomonadaceae bacterium]
MTIPDKEIRKANRLINEKSPYLLQHAHNPVDWYPWGAEAFEKAKAEDKPVFLSIGYSTCHWCHVMERESFEDKQVAEALKKGFIAIKVDREERTDLDHIYMSFCQAFTGQGGWPLSVFLSPDRKPFFAGTYFTRESRGGLPGFIDVLRVVSDAWNTQRQVILEQSQVILDHLNRPAVKRNGKTISEVDLDRGFEHLEKSFDHSFGGFNQAPKFPSPHLLTFLLRYGVLKDKPRALEMVAGTLEGMYRGGIYDHIGGGFSRYSTDERWLVPHFEKMLYDNALLAIAFTEAYQILGKEEYRMVVEDTLGYLLRDMVSPEGGFFSAEDADSEGVEGKFYVWTPEEVIEILGEKEGQKFCEFYDITEAGNFEGSSIPNLIGIPLEDIKAKKDFFNEAQKKLWKSRENRVHPFKDDKILTSWNGLMIAALAKGYQVFGINAYKEAAERALQFILDNLRSEKGRLLARFRDGEAAFPAYADDYAYMVWGILELYEATFEGKYLEMALELNQELLDYFWDGEEGGLYFYGSDVEEQILRTKEIYDGALPSANSVAASNFIRLSRLTDAPELEEKAAQIMSTFATTIKQFPSGYAAMLSSSLWLLLPSREVVVKGNSDDNDARGMLEFLQRTFLPNTVILFSPETSQDQRMLINRALQ